MSKSIFEAQADEGAQRHPRQRAQVGTEAQENAWNLKTQSNAYAKKKEEAGLFFFKENKTPQLSLKPVDGIIFISSRYLVEIIYNNQSVNVLLNKLRDPNKQTKVK